MFSFQLSVGVVAARDHKCAGVVAVTALVLRSTNKTVVSVRIVWTRNVASARVVASCPLDGRNACAQVRLCLAFFHSIQRVCRRSRLPWLQGSGHLLRTIEVAIAETRQHHGCGSSRAGASRHRHSDIYFVGFCASRCGCRYALGF